MIRLTKKLLFAIEAVLDIAYNGSAAPVRSVEITESEGIPRRYLEPVLQELVRQGILVGMRGTGDGHCLARARPHQLRRQRAHRAPARNRRRPDQRSGGQRAQPSGSPPALARIAGGD